MLSFIRIYPEKAGGYLSIHPSEERHGLVVDSLTSKEIVVALKEVSERLDIELLESTLSIVELWEWLPKLHNKNVPAETVNAVTQAFEPIFSALELEMTNLVTEVAATGQFVLYMRRGKKARLVWEDTIRWQHPYVPGSRALQAVPPLPASS